MWPPCGSFNAKFKLLYLENVLQCWQPFIPSSIHSTITYEHLLCARHRPTNGDLRWSWSPPSSSSIYCIILLTPPVLDSWCKLLQCRFSGSPPDPGISLSDIGALESTSYKPPRWRIDTEVWEPLDGGWGDLDKQAIITQRTVIYTNYGGCQGRILGGGDF